MDEVRSRAAVETRTAGGQYGDRWRGTAAIVAVLVTALREIEMELTQGLGEAAIRRLRKILLDVLDRPAFTRREGEQRPQPRPDRGAEPTTSRGSGRGRGGRGEA